MTSCCLVNTWRHKPKDSNVHVARGVACGSGAATPDGKINFGTAEEIIILPGELYGAAPAECLTAGTVGNGFLPGQINKIVGGGYVPVFSGR